MMKGDPTRVPHVTADQVLTFFEAVPIGVDNALTARDLAPLLELEPAHADRALRALVESAIIDHGLLVCTGNPGYWRPVSRDEAAQSVGWKKSQALRMLERVKAEASLLDKEFPAGDGSTAGDGLPDTSAVFTDPTPFVDIVGEPMPLFSEGVLSDSFIHQVQGRGK
jgi:hypothetical protein